MSFLRSVLTIFCFGLFGIGGFFIGTLIFSIIILFFHGQKQRFILANTVHFSWILFVKIMVFLRLIRVEVQKKKSFNDTKGTIIVANHPTLLDIVLIISVVPNCVCLVKSSLAKNFFIKHIIQRIYLINDTSADIFLEKAQSLLSQGLNIVIFPEGTRTDFSKKQNLWHRGFAHLALRSKAPVLPVKISCTPQILGKGQKWYAVDRCTVLYRLCLLSPVKDVIQPNLPERVQIKSFAEDIRAKLFKNN